MKQQYEEKLRKVEYILMKGTNERMQHIKAQMNQNEELEALRRKSKFSQRL